MERLKDVDPPIEVDRGIVFRNEKGRRNGDIFSA